MILHHHYFDYSGKMRFIQVPENSKILFDEQSNFIYPVNTLIKTFFYLADIRDMKQKHLIETGIEKYIIRMGVFPYVWNENQTDAKLSLAGARLQHHGLIMMANHRNTRRFQILISVKIVIH